LSLLCFTSFTICTFTIWTRLYSYNLLSFAYFFFDIWALCCGKSPLNKNEITLLTPFNMPLNKLKASNYRLTDLLFVNGVERIVSTHPFYVSAFSKLHQR
jgi:hypothetical protein